MARAEGSPARAGAKEGVEGRLRWPAEVGCGLVSDWFGGGADAGAGGFDRDGGDDRRDAFLVVSLFSSSLLLSTLFSLPLFPTLSLSLFSPTPISPRSLCHPHLFRKHVSLPLLLPLIDYGCHTFYLCE